MSADPLDQHQQDWLDHLDRQGKSRATLRAYARSMNHFRRWYRTTYGDAFAPQTVMPREVREWKAHQQTREKAAPATINQRLVALTRFFHWARTQGVCRENPAAEVESIPLPPRKPQALTVTELRKLLRAGYGHRRDYAMLELLSGIGLRVGELLALTIGDLVLAERSGQVTVRQGTGASYREIPLPLDVRKALTAYLAEAHPAAENPAAPLWLGTRGKLRNPGSVIRIVAKYALAAGIAAVNPHALRHTFATRYLAANLEDLRGLARLLGHKSLDTVMIYTEPSMQDLAERMERMAVAPLERAA